MICDDDAVGEIRIRRDGDRYIATLLLVPGSAITRANVVFGQGNGVPRITGKGPTLDSAKDDLLRNLGLATFYTAFEDS